MTSRRQPWETLYDRIRVVRPGSAVPVPPPTDADLEATEAALGCPLPPSYRAFMRRFGPGMLMNWVRLEPPTRPRKRKDRSTVAGDTAHHRSYFAENTAGRPNHDWLATLVYFGSSVGGDLYSWDPAARTRTRPAEFRFYEHPHEFEEQARPVGHSFRQCVEWVYRNVKSWRDEDVAEEDGPGIVFTPDTRRRARRRP